MAGSRFLPSHLGPAFHLPLPTRRGGGGWDWRQKDWSGGAGQIYFVDDAGYLNSSQMDTMSVPGTLRLSHVAAPFTKSPSNPVLTMGASGSRDYIDVNGTPLRKEGGGYLVLYEGSGLPATALCYASSPNGPNWVKHPGNPVITPAAPPSWNDNGLHPESLTFDGGIYKMVIRGLNLAGLTSCGEAWSADGTAWTVVTNGGTVPAGPIPHDHLCQPRPGAGPGELLSDLVGSAGDLRATHVLPLPGIPRLQLAGRARFAGLRALIHQVGGEREARAGC